MCGHPSYISDHIPVSIKGGDSIIFHHALLRTLVAPLQKRRLIYERFAAVAAMVVLLHLYGTPLHRCYNPLPEGL